MGKLSQKETVKLLEGLNQQFHGMSKEEFKAGGVANAIAAVANTSGIDRESIDASIGTVGKYNYANDVKLMGASAKELVGFKGESGSIDAESFDTLNSQNHETIQLAAINIAGNNLKVEEDGIVSLFSKETVSGNVTGKSFIAANPLITIGAINRNGIAIGGERVSLISNLDNKDIFSKGRRAFRPVLRTTGDYKTSDNLLVEVPTSVDYNGSLVQTAPIKVGKQIPLRTLCSTEQYLTSHTDGFNPNVTLSEEASINTIYFELNGTYDDGGTPTAVKNIIAAKVKGQKNTRFATVGQGNGKDISLTFSSRARIKAKDFTAAKALKYTSVAGKTVLVSTSDIELVVDFSISASINTDTMKLVTSATALTLVEAFDGSTSIDSSESTFTEFKALVAASSIDGIDFDLFLSNTNNADNGIVIDIEEENFELPAVIKSPVTIRKSVVGDVPADKIAGYLASAKVAANSIKAAELLSVVDDFIASNIDKVDAEGFIKDIEIDGVGVNYIKGMIIKDTISAANRSTRRSGETKEDISHYIYDVIVSKALEVFTKSNLDKAIDVLATGERPTLVLTTGATVASYIQDAINARKGSEMKFDVAIETSYQLSSRVLGTFKVGTKIYECSPLILVEGPDFIYKGVETTGGENGNQEVTKLVPRRGSLVNAPIIFDFTVSGIVTALNK